VDVHLEEDHCLSSRRMYVPPPSIERRLGIVDQILGAYGIKAPHVVQELLAGLSDRDLNPVVGAAHYCGQTQKLRTLPLDLVSVTEMIHNYDQGLLR
jgi:hypothetical protein